MKRATKRPPAKRNSAARSDCPITNDPVQRDKAYALAAAIQANFPKISQPALRALARGGYTHLGQLAGAREQDLLELHGMGPQALGMLKAALKAKKLAFRR